MSEDRFDILCLDKFELMDNNPANRFEFNQNEMNTIKEKNAGSAQNLENLKDFKEIFKFVKRSVKAILNRERAGLMLILADLPLRIGAFHGLGSNAIVMNRRLLEAVKDVTNTKLELNSYIFIILLHEYIHSLGCVDEEMTRRLVYDISIEIFGEDHPATKMAIDGISRVFEHSKVRSYQDLRSPEIIKEFDSSYNRYIH